ncbi:hypothetical protein SH1V18_47100 [Vallitalea longa]|uniref:Uncharacterized protein n=1 Tax=Vallitalea longa TaxID=2936439 RepID=A0A9W5YDR8_9FIRM|nr:hypothetical protein SH1V18_47100 [Vallitalea longa]
MLKYKDKKCIVKGVMIINNLLKEKVLWNIAFLILLDL